MPTVKHTPWVYPTRVSNDWVEFVPTNPNATFFSYWTVNSRGESVCKDTKPFNRPDYLTAKDILELMKDYYEQQSRDL